MKRILAILLILCSIQVDAQPWFWGNATYQAQKPNLYWRWLDSSGTTMLKYIPNGGGLINTNNTTLPAGLNTTGSNRMVQSYREGSTNVWQIGSWGTGAAVNISTYVAGGTMASPTATQATNQLFFITSNGHDGTAYGSGVGFLANAATNWTNTTGGHLVNWDIRHPSPTSNTQKASIAYVGTTNGLYLMPSSAIGGRVSVGGSTLLIPHAQLDVHTQNPGDTGLCVNGVTGQTAALQVWSVNSAVIDSVKPDGTFVVKKSVVYNAGTSSRTDSFATLDPTTHEIVMAAIPTGGAFYDSVKMATQYRLDTVKANIRTQIAAISGVSNVTATAPISSSGGSTPNITLDTTTLSGGWHSYNYYKTVFANITHTHAWTDIIGTPTTIAGYGITDYNSLWDTRFATKHRIDSAGYADTAKYAVNAGQAQNTWLTNITSDNATNASEYITWVQGNTGNLAQIVSTALRYNPSTATLSSTNFSGALSGNASTATILQTGRNINGVLFNGSADITVTAAAGTLTGSSLNSTVTGSSLTSVGTIGTGTWQGTVINPTYGGTGVNNGTKTITLGGNLTTSGAFATTLTTTNTTSVTLPTSGTLATLAGSETFTNKTLTSSTNTLGGVTMGLGSDATGDIYYRNSGGVFTRLPIGSSSQVLTVSGGLPTWAAAGGGGGGTNPVIYVQTADASVTNSTTETNMLGTGNGSATLSAGVSNHIGDQIEIYASGQFILPSSASGNSVWKLYYGSTALATSPTMDVSSATGAFVTGTGNWEFKGAIVTRTTGATGTVMVTGVLTITGTGSGNPSFPYAYAVKMDNVTATTVDLTATQAITLTQKFSTAQTGKTANGKNCIIKYHGTP